MKPLKLTMQAFGSYGERTSIDFEEPRQKLFLITGDTGAGKTTIFDAIVFALYGEASSGANRKDGAELQSQFADLMLEPYVELIFSEGTGADHRCYTVRRVPRHIRAKKKGVGVMEESETVSLIMPDGVEYPQKETDSKLVEIVGLTKSQFMQVAMIAQGEFMELLRAKSDDKKVIFRKLFHTETYQRIAEELGRRRKEKEKELGIIRTACQTEASHVTIPEGYGRADELKLLKKRILDGEMAAMETFLIELTQLCGQLKTEREQANRLCRETGRLRDEKRDKYTRAQQLKTLFAQLDEAELVLAECQAQEEEIQKAETLSRQLTDAYEIKSVYDRYRDADQVVTKTKQSLKQQQDEFPGLAEAEKASADREAEGKREFDEALSAFSKVAERVEKAKELFAKIDRAGTDMEARQKALAQTVAAAKAQQEKLKKLEAQEKDWRIQSEELSGAGEQLAYWKGKREEAVALTEDAKGAAELQLAVVVQEKKAKKSKRAYEAAGEKYQQASREYETARKAFLDEQAGVLARELRPGMPCPVCGSLEHPTPYPWREEHEAITREAIEAMERNVGVLRSEQEHLAAEARSDRDLLAEKESTAKAALEKLCIRIEKSIPEDFGERSDCESEQTGKAIENRECDTSDKWNAAEKQAGGIIRMQRRIEEWKQLVEGNCTGYARKVEAYEELQTSLRGVEERRSRLTESIDAEDKKARAAEGELEAARATLVSLKDAREFPTVEEAGEALRQARDLKEQRERSYKSASKAAEQARKARNDCDAMIRKFVQELPGQEEKQEERRGEYEQTMARKGLAEAEWKALTEKYDREEALRLQQKADAYRTKKIAAVQKETSAKEAIGGQKRPDLEMAKREMDEAEAARKLAERNLEQYKDDAKVNGDAYDKLAPKMAERQRIVEEHTRLDTLYRLISGNASGSRMDLETYVQRYYLERILYAANSRFLDMSAGQFELRMYELEKAGEGRNRGLDLMVYSNVTGKEREVRTLSGGESFMAALSLALGMADQIQESATAINLDIMFIDEGFGSLDEHSRNQAVKVLKNMAGGTKLVGIISHVTELKQEMDEQLLVTKDEKGSHVAWQIS